MKYQIGTRYACLNEVEREKVETSSIIYTLARVNKNYYIKLF